MNISFVLAALILSAAALWPIPQHYTHGEQVVWLSPGVDFEFQPSLQNISQSVPQKSMVRQLMAYVGLVPTACLCIRRAWLTALPYSKWTGRKQMSTAPSDPEIAILESAIARVKQSILGNQFVPWKFHPRGSVFEPSTDAKVSITKILIQQITPAQTWQTSGSVNDLDESYTLRILENGEVIITTVSYLGVLHALQTFSQLFYKHSDAAAGVYTPLAPVDISDYPSFQHRGLNMDISRNIFTPADIIRTIDAMAASKFNRLHIHAADGQSWPIDIPSIPELGANCSYYPDLVWTAQDLEDVQAYGYSRGITVILEIDMPGHTASIAHAFPDLITADSRAEWHPYAAEPPSGQLKLNSSAVYTFIDDLLSDLLPRTTPHSAYFHTGGDEVNINAYLLDDTVRSNDTAILQPLLQTFITTVHDKVRAGGAIPIVWEELLLDWNITLGADVLVQTWRSEDALLRTVQQGHKALAGNYNNWYLDCGFGQWLDPTPNSTLIVPPFVDYCGPLKNWRQIYTYDPLAGIPAELTSLVVGGEVHMWAEQTDAVDLDGKLWPRAAAAAEVLWSGRTDVQGRVREVRDATRRLAELRERLVLSGVRAGPVQMVWCLMNEGGCAL